MVKASHTQLSAAAAERLQSWRTGGFLPDWAQAALEELIQAHAWEELEDRFYREITFGTGGMRGRVIGRQPAQAELGPGGIASPAHPAVGANTLNDLTVTRATLGLYRGVAVSGKTPKLILAHDVRHFSRRFAELAAQVWTSLGGEAWLFDGPRSTPQLSFSVRAIGADAGVVLTASHNPPHDNGYKVYASYGGQIVPPFADKIVESVLSVRPSELGLVYGCAIEAGACWNMVPEEIEEQYREAAKQVALDPALIKKQRPRLAYSALHGTGGVLIPDLLRQLGAEVAEVAVQAVPDANFSTVPSPNPEDGRALAMTVEQARNSQADAGLATDPDSDRIGSVFRERDGSYRALNGNELGALFAEYRLRRAKELGWLPPEGSDRAVVLKTFVTTPLLDAIAHGHGVRCVNTLTGFKWMGAKLRHYEEMLLAGLAAAGDKRGLPEIAQLPPRERAALELRHGAWLVLAAEESYGCLAGDTVRDKDANGAAVMAAELAAWLKEQGLTATEALDQIYARHGYHREALRTLTFEGAAGAAQIQQVLKSLRADSPAALGGRAVGQTLDFGREERRDEEGAAVPREDFFLLYELAENWRCAIRGSGTEPKVKIYFFARAPLARAADRPALEAAMSPQFEAWTTAIVQEIRRRAGD